MGCGEWQCLHCGAWNDPGEKCDCEQKESPAPASKQDKQNNYMLIIRQEGEKSNGILQ